MLSALAASAIRSTILRLVLGDHLAAHIADRSARRRRLRPSAAAMPSWISVAAGPSGRSRSTELLPTCQITRSGLCGEHVAVEARQHVGGVLAVDAAVETVIVGRGNSACSRPRAGSDRTAPASSRRRRTSTTSRWRRWSAATLASEHLRRCASADESRRDQIAGAAHGKGRAALRVAACARRSRGDERHATATRPTRQGAGWHRENPRADLHCTARRLPAPRDAPASMIMDGQRPADDIRAPAWPCSYPWSRRRDRTDPTHTSAA